MSNNEGKVAVLEGAGSGENYKNEIFRGVTTNEGKVAVLEGAGSGEKYKSVNIET